jgi:hypothetical protein
MTGVLVTIDTPDGPRDLSVPAQVTIEGLLEMLSPTVSGSSGLRGWTLMDEHGTVITPSSSLEEAGVLDGTRLALAPAGVARQTGAPPASPSVRVAAHDRANRVIPDRTPKAGRVLTALSALIGRHRPPHSHGPLDRMRRAWEWTDHGRRLEWLLTRPRIRRSVFVGVVGHRSDELAERLADTVAASRLERVVLVDSSGTAAISRRLRVRGAGLETIESGLRRRDITSIERDLLFGRTNRGTLVVPTDPSHPPPAAATMRRLCDSLRAHAGLIVVDCGTPETPNAALLESCDQIVVSSTGAMPRFEVQTIAATWGGDEPPPDRDLYASRQVSDDPTSVTELAVVVASGWSAIDAATPVPLGL